MQLNTHYWDVCSETKYNLFILYSCFNVVLKSHYKYKKISHQEAHILVFYLRELFTKNIC